jgi:hypothetical protein
MHVHCQQVAASIVFVLRDQQRLRELRLLLCSVIRDALHDAVQRVELRRERGRARLAFLRHVLWVRREPPLHATKRLQDFEFTAIGVGSTLIGAG